MRTDGMPDLLWDMLRLTTMLAMAWWLLGAALKELSSMGKRPFHPYWVALQLVGAVVFIGGFFYVGSRM